MDEPVPDDDVVEPLVPASLCAIAPLVDVPAPLLVCVVPLDVAAPEDVPEGVGSSDDEQPAAVIPIPSTTIV